ncbi:MAG: ABC transporter permease [Proteobacteria bacterium]|nr:ABC transporter permease [Pseudomonadota bacterium]
MLRYALTRLLWMPPTFFLASLVVFAVLTLAPGRPAEPAQAHGMPRQTVQRESYRAFREQFNLDKPVLLNIDPWLTRAEVRRLLRFANAKRFAYPKDPDSPAAERLRAQHRLDDAGNYLVRHLIALLDDRDSDVQRLAVSELAGLAERPSRPDQEPLETAWRRLESFRAGGEAPAPLVWQHTASRERIDAVKARWRGWWASNSSAFEHTTAEQLQSLFLDTRFAKYWSNLLRLDFGRSNRSRRPVLEVIAEKLRYSLSFTVLAVLLAYLIAVPIGIMSALKERTLIDTLSTLLLFLLYSLPAFFLATVVLRLLSEGAPFAWFPSGGFEALGSEYRTTTERIRNVAWHLALPVATYAAVSLAALSRYARAGIIEVVRADYIRTARAKGLPELVVIVRHIARNGMIPILTLLGGMLPVLVSGSVVIEVVFNIPGVGMFLYESIAARDYNAVMGVLVSTTALTLLGVLLSDLLYALADPRITFD